MGFYDCFRYWQAESRTFIVTVHPAECIEYTWQILLMDANPRVQDLDENLASIVGDPYCYYPIILALSDLNSLTHRRLDEIGTVRFLEQLDRFGSRTMGGGYPGNPHFPKSLYH